MDLKEELERRRAENDEVRYNFILAEMDLALTFVKVAVSADDIEKRERNLRHARQAYKSAMTNLDKHPLSPPMYQAVESRVGELHEILERLPARVNFKTLE